jgi:hypothetical protein
VEFVLLFVVVEAEPRESRFVCGLKAATRRKRGWAVAV